MRASDVTPIYERRDDLLAFAAPILDCTFFEDAQAIGVERGGEIVAAVIYEGFTRWDCRIHVASDGSRRWLSRGFLVRVFAYPFLQCGLRRVTALVEEGNLAALKLDLGIGFQVEGRLKDATPEGDMIVLGMTRARCPWIPKEARHG